MLIGCYGSRPYWNCERFDFFNQLHNLPTTRNSLNQTSKINYVLTIATQEFSDATCFHQFFIINQNATVGIRKQQ